MNRAIRKGWPPENSGVYKFDPFNYEYLGGILSLVLGESLLTFKLIKSYLNKIVAEGLYFIDID